MASASRPTPRRIAVSANDEGRAGVERAYASDKLARLTTLKDTYDPDNLFHPNDNIAPSGH
jgi:FAD/FMN-containing dehydrogenase